MRKNNRQEIILSTNLMIVPAQYRQAVLPYLVLEVKMFSDANQSL